MIPNHRVPEVYSPIICTVIQEGVLFGVSIDFFPPLPVLRVEFTSLVFKYVKEEKRDTNISENVGIRKFRLLVSGLHSIGCSTLGIEQE